MAVSNPQRPHAARPHLGWVLGLTSTAYFMVVLDSVVVITALPRMQQGLHAGLASLQRTLTGYNIAFAAGIITAAAAGDRFALLAALSALAITPARTQPAPALGPAEGLLIREEQGMT